VVTYFIGVPAFWGYYNTTNITGSAGWGTVEPTDGNGQRWAVLVVFDG